MQQYPESIRTLIRSLSKLPGVGEKTAERLAIFILRKPVNEAEALAQSILEVKQKVRLCSRCYGLSDAELCHICQDSGRDAALICVVEQPTDMMAIEKSGAFRGVYHVLGGALAPMEGIGPEELRIRELLERLRRREAKEIILATGTGVEGESTAAYIAQQCSPYEIKVTRIASGIPVGGDLKYIDKMTLKCALDGRHAV